ncbi:MAG: lipoprotein insertase outer membrane protein LolB [Gammaproteobacteria bacterium]
MRRAILHAPAALLACAALLAGCATPRPAAPPDAPPEVLWQQRMEKIAAISGWRIKGRIAFQSGDEGGSASLLWTRRREHQQIELYAPFGAGRMRIEAAPGRALLRDAAGDIIEADSADDALYQRLGWRVPFGALTHWARGLPGDASDFDLDAAGRLRALRQGRWQVRYREYARAGTIWLPRKLTITATGEAGESALNVKILLQSWRDVRFDD